jgi:hypothetical protein
MGGLYGQSVGEKTGEDRRSGRAPGELRRLAARSNKCFSQKKRPATAGLMITGKNSSRFLDVSCLRPLGPLYDLKFDWISFLKSAITVSDDRGIMNENIWAIFAPDEAVSFRIVEPLDSS